MVQKPAKVYWSYSKLKTFQTCKEKFYRQYILKEKGRENQRNFLEGNVLQSTFENFINRGAHTRPEEEHMPWIEKNLEAYYRYHKTRPGVIMEFHKKDSDERFIRLLTKSAKAVYEMMKFKGYVGHKAIQSEVKVDKEIWPGVLLGGKLDFLVKDSGFIVFDLKNSTHESKYIDPQQLLFYNVLLYLQTGALAKESFFFCAKDNKILPVDANKDAINAFVQEIKAATKTVMSTKYRRKVEDMSVCWGCKYKDPCWSQSGFGVKDRGELDFGFKETEEKAADASASLELDLGEGE